jgi:hypothetical protein
MAILSAEIRRGGAEQRMSQIGLPKSSEKEGRDVSHRTIEDNVRRILRELKAASAAKPVSR